MTVARGAFASVRRSGPDSSRMRKALFGGPTTPSPRERSMSRHPLRDEAIRVQVFGGPHLFRLGEKVQLSSQQGAFLGLLFGSGKEVLERSRVVALLWPDSDQTKARKCLSQLIYILRARIGNHPVFWTRGEDIHWSGIREESDLLQFEADLRNGNLPACAQRLEMGFLPRLAATSNRQFSAWMESREAELRRSLRSRAELSWLEAKREEDWDGARTASETLLRLFPLDEERLQRVLESRAKTGPPEEAEEAAHEFRIRFEEAHGHSWKPNPTSMRLLNEIESLTVPDAGRTAGTRLAPIPEPPFLGRSSEKAELRASLTSVPRKALPATLVIGEAGIGKSRLIREALRGISLDGYRVFSAGLGELEQMIPLNPLIEAFSTPRVGATVREMDEPWRTVLLGVMPSHYAGKHPLPEAPHIQPGSVPRRLFEAFHQLFLALVEDRPVILVLEDLHWADETTLSLLEFLIRRWDRGGLHMVFSVRSEEANRASVLTRFIENLRTIDRFLEISLTDLDGSASEALIENLCPGARGAGSVRYLRSLAGGNPFFLIELTLEFLAGRLEPEVILPQDSVSIPLSILQVLQRRLSQLSEDAERILEVLAVFNRPLKLSGLARITRLSGAKCLAGLDQLHEFRMVVSHDTEEIRHELIRQTVYQKLNPSRRALLHERVARYILSRREKTPPDELAVHFHRAGATAEAAKYSIQAADRAETSGAIPEALRFLGMAREHSRDPEEVANLVGRMGRLNYLHQDFDKAAPLLELASQRFRRQGKTLEALRAEVQHIDSLAQNGQIPHEDCLEELQRLKGEAKRFGDWGVFTLALDVEIHRLDHKGDILGVERVLREARMCANLGGPDARCQARSILALNVYYGSPKEALTAAREAVAISLETQDADLQLHALNRLIVALLYQGRLGSLEGIEAFRLAEPRLQRTGDIILKFFVRLNKAVGLLEAGELAAAQTAFASAESVINGTKAIHALVTLLLNMGELYLASHDHVAASQHYSRAQALLTASSPEASRTIINAGLGVCALRSGDLSQARLREANLPPIPPLWTFDPFVVVSFKASMLKKRGDWGSADRLLAEVAKDVRPRLVTAWIKLSIVRADLWKRLDPEKATRIAERALPVAAELSLSARVSQLLGLIPPDRRRRHLDELR
jgi:DNA-binding SARP family transcriptional activator/tetratricopeptide (TPR) repeat protein